MKSKENINTGVNGDTTNTKVNSNTNKMSSGQLESHYYPPPSTSQEGEDEDIDITTTKSQSSVSSQNDDVDYEADEENSENIDKIVSNQPKKNEQLASSTSELNKDEDFVKVDSMTTEVNSNDNNVASNNNNNNNNAINSHSDNNNVEHGNDYVTLTMNYNNDNGDDDEDEDSDIQDNEYVVLPEAVNIDDENITNSQIDSTGLIQDPKLIIKDLDLSSDQR